MALGWGCDFRNQRCRFNRKISVSYCSGPFPFMEPLPPHKKGGKGRGTPQRSQHGVWVPNPTKHVTNRGGMPQTAGVSLRPVWNPLGVKHGSLALGSPLSGTPQQPEALLELSLTPSESWRHYQSHRSRQGGSPMMPPHQRLLHYLLEPF